MLPLSDAANFEIAIAGLHAVAPQFAVLSERHGTPSLRKADASLATLLRIVTEQFLSLNAAEAIWLRVAARLGVCDADSVLAVSAEDYLKLGLSRAKAKGFHGIAQAVKSQTLVFENLAAMKGDAVEKSLCLLPGVGPWTSAIFRLSALQDHDAWPAGDVALQIAAQRFFNFQKRPTAKEMMALAENWRPWRAVAARLLWAHYRHLKGKPDA